MNVLICLVGSIAEFYGRDSFYKLSLLSIALRAAGIICLAILFAGCAGRSTGFIAYNHGKYETALEEFRKEDDSSAHFALGVMYYKGEGVKKDRQKALSMFLKAAREGHEGAQFNLGLMYANGEGVRKDYREAARWYQIAAEEGYDKAQYNLGVMYERGDGVDRNQRRALYWFVKSARQGNSLAMKALEKRKDELRKYGALAEDDN